MFNVNMTVLKPTPLSCYHKNSGKMLIKQVVYGILVFLLTLAAAILLFLKKQKKILPGFYSRVFQTQKLKNIDKKSYFLCQDNKQSPEDSNEVNEQFKGVLHKVLVAHATLFDDELCVEQDKATHQHKPKVQMSLK